jgi:ABC-type cobalt transport system substrate-binding protein
VVFDVSVLCNILCFVQTYNLEWTKADSASLEVIVQTIKKNYHITKPIYASPYYSKTSLILYHVARLMSIKKISQLDELKMKLITDAANEFVHSDNLLEKVILSNAILKWGYVPPLFKLPQSNEVETKIEKNDFSFFVGNVPSYFHDALRKYATNKNIWLFYHYCPAYNDVLLLEYLVLKNKP